MFRIIEIAAATLIAAGMAAAQTPAAPSFEVATIKAAPPLNPALIAQGKIHVGMKVDGARVDIGFASIGELIREAYEVKLYQVSGPDWLMTERFDIMAKMPDGANKDQVPAMLKALLADRFKLTVHKENRDHPVYSLVVGKNGPKMKEALPDPAAPAASADPSAPAQKGMSVETNDGTIHMTRNADGHGATITNPKGGTANVTMGGDGMMHMEFSKMSMPDFADALSRYVDRPVVDDTGLKGSYQVALDISIQDMMRIARSAGLNLPGAGPAGPATLSGDGASEPGSSSVFSAVQVLGLKLEPKKEPVETIVVDHVEKAPTEN